MKNSEIKGLSLEELKSKVAAEKDSLDKLKICSCNYPYRKPNEVERL
ncbi:50S ribosomal protein L29 [Reichenbachiella agarivorans]|uniref:50S ribosomal protein L29 n=1 Tax=Reichenbachiella agarivorans TaxID=2979464 RepID=A0ABY6CQN6_9BACT|nr:50S ribosomal protein L29 [Reichenbachiella agarivorans]